MLFNTYPSDPIVGEESASDLRNEAAISLRERIITLANEYIEKELEEGEMAEWGIGPGKAKSGTDLLDAIDRGNFTGGRTGRKCTPRLISLSSHTHTHNSMGKEQVHGVSTRSTVQKVFYAKTANMLSA